MEELSTSQPSPAVLEVKRRIERRREEEAKKALAKNPSFVSKNPDSKSSKASSVATAVPRKSFKEQMEDLKKSSRVQQSPIPDEWTSLKESSVKREPNPVIDGYGAQIKAFILWIMVVPPLHWSILIQLAVFFWKDYSTGSFPVIFHGWTSFLLTQVIYGICGSFVYFLGEHLTIDNITAHKAFVEKLENPFGRTSQPIAEQKLRVSDVLRQGSKRSMPTGLTQSYNVSKKIVKFTKSNWKVLGALVFVGITVPLVYPRTACLDRQSVWLCIVPDLYDLIDTPPPKPPPPLTSIPVKDEDKTTRLTKLVDRNADIQTKNALMVKNMSNVQEWNTTKAGEYAKLAWDTCSAERLGIDEANVSASIKFYNSCTTNLATATASPDNKPIHHMGLLYLGGATVTRNVPDFIPVVSLVKYQLAEYEKKARDVSAECIHGVFDVMTIDSGLVIKDTRQTHLQFHGVAEYIRLGTECLNQTMNTTEFATLTDDFEYALENGRMYIEVRVAEAYKKIENTQKLRDAEVTKAMEIAAETHRKLVISEETVAMYKHAMVVVSVSFIVIYLFSTAGAGVAVTGVAHTVAQAALPGPAQATQTYGMLHAIGKCAWAWFVHR